MFRSPTKKAAKLIQQFDTWAPRMDAAVEDLQKSIQCDERMYQTVFKISAVAARVVLWVINRMADLEDKANQCIRGRILDKRLDIAGIRYRKAMMGDRA